MLTVSFHFDNTPNFSWGIFSFGQGEVPLASLVSISCARWTQEKGQALPSRRLNLRMQLVDRSFPAYISAGARPSRIPPTQVVAGKLQFVDQSLINQLRNQTTN